MAKKNRAYKSAKRAKELNRLRDREEKRKRRLERKGQGPPIEGETPAEGAVPPAAEPGSENKEPE